MNDDHISSIKWHDGQAGPILQAPHLDTQCYQLPVTSYHSPLDQELESTQVSYDWRSLSANFILSEVCKQVVCLHANGSQAGGSTMHAQRIG